MPKTATPRKPQESGRHIEIVETDSQDVQMMRSDGSVVQQFLAGLIPFFTIAQEKEGEAKLTLHRAKALVAPKDADEDGKIQIFIKDINAQTKSLEEHWTVATAFHQIHRKLTAKRGLALTALESAKTIAQNLHNRYAEEAERQRQAENRRLQQEADERARQDRERELELIEQAAVDAEAASADLSEREAFFVAQIDAGDLPVRAAKAAGYKNPEASAVKLMHAPKIMQAILDKQTARALREQASAVREMPVQTTHYEAEKQIKKIGTDRTTWSAEVYDVEAFMAVVLDPTSRMRYGVPADVATFVQTKVNDLAKALHEKLDVVPGIRAKKNVSTY